MNRLLTILLAVLIATSGVSSVALAQTSEETSYFDQLREPGDQGADGILPENFGQSIADRLSWATSLGDRYYQVWVEDADEENATAYADDFQSTFNQHNETLIAYANKRMNASTSHDVIAIKFHDHAGNEETRYLVQTVSNDTIQSAKIVESTNRTVDDNITADWYVSRNADEELQAFVDEYAEPDEDVTTSYWAEMVAKYGGGINSTLWGGAS